MKQALQTMMRLSVIRGIPHDKLLHFTGGVLLTLFLFIPFGVVLGAFVSFMVALIWETMDKVASDSFDWYDVVAHLFGVIAVLVWVATTLFVHA